MTALSTAEAALRRMPDDPKQPVTLSGAEAAALTRELDGLRERGDELAVVLKNCLVNDRNDIGLPHGRAATALSQWRSP